MREATKRSAREKFPRAFRQNSECDKISIEDENITRFYHCFTLQMFIFAYSTKRHIFSVFVFYDLRDLYILYIIIQCQITRKKKLVEN